MPLLLLVARDLLLYDPPRVLAWRLLHEPQLAALPRWLAALLPRSGPFDRDPLALLLGAVCSGLAVALLGAGLWRAALRVRALLLMAGAAAAVVLPTLALMAMGAAMDRPYGQDGGVVQLPLALDALAAGRSPYAVDYGDTILGRQARVSPFWRAYGGNPLLRHHAYLPGTHLLMFPGYLAARLLGLAFDPRAMTLLAWAAAAWLGARLVRAAGGGAEAALAAAALVLVNPLVYWHQVFGANDVLPAALLLLSVMMAATGRPLIGAALLGLACATKQLAWPYAPFLLAHLSGARSLREVARPPALRRLAAPAAVAAGVFAAVVLPVAALDFAGFWDDIVVYNVGLPGSHSYPLGGTPGFGFANFLIYTGQVSSLRDHVSFAPFYALLVPLGLLLLNRQLREAHPGAALVTGSAALLASVYVSRVAHPNYLVMAAVLLPIGLLACAAAGPRERDRSWGLETALVPLALALSAVELVEHEALRAVWDDAAGARLSPKLAGVWTMLWPRTWPELAADPLGLLFGALAAGLAVAWLCLSALGLRQRWRSMLAAAAFACVVFAPAAALSKVGAATGAPRAQDPWFVAVSQAARRGSGITDPVPPREAWSQSFRRDPPRDLAGDVDGAPPQRLVGRALAAAGAVDPRTLLAAAVAVAGLLAAWWAGPGRRALAFAALALGPVAVGAALFGSGAPLALALLVAALVLQPLPIVAAAFLGLAAGVFPPLALAAPLLVAGRGRAPWMALLGGFTAVVAVAVLATGARWPWPSLGPGLGLANLLLYAGAVAVPGAVLAALAVAAAVAGAVILARRRPVLPALAEAAFVLLAALWLWPSASPHDLLLPLALLTLAAIDRARDPRFDTRVGQLLE